MYPIFDLCQLIGTQKVSSVSSVTSDYVRETYTGCVIVVFTGLRDLQDSQSKTNLVFVLGEVLITTCLLFLYNKEY